MANTAASNFFRNIKFTLKTVRKHPLTRDHKLAALKRWLSWQIGSRLAPGPVLISFINDTKLLVKPSMYGATMNIYVGLGEFEDMAFTLHFLRPQDCFVDVGANVGVFTMLGSGVVGCTSHAFEPTPSAFKGLEANILLNNLMDKVQCHAAAIGNKPGTITFTDSLDTLNHIVLDRSGENTIDVPAITLDAVFADSPAPTMIKIDVEGYEYPALVGAEALLQDSGLQALLVEMNPGTNRYGYTCEQVFDKICGSSFTACSYNPITRSLTPLSKSDWETADGPNTIFIRDVEAARKRVHDARPFHVLGQSI